MPVIWNLEFEIYMVGLYARTLKFVICNFGFWNLYDRIEKEGNYELQNKKVGEGEKEF